MSQVQVVSNRERHREPDRAASTKRDDLSRAKLLQEQRVLQRPVRHTARGKVNAKAQECTRLSRELLLPQANLAQNNLSKANPTAARTKKAKPRLFQRPNETGYSRLEYQTAAQIVGGYNNSAICTAFSAAPLSS